MTQVFALHSTYGLATAVAAIDAGLLGDEERVLVPFTSSRVPETSVGIAADPALNTLRDRFDRIEDLDAVLGPLHPSFWEPRDVDLPVLERLLARAWNVDARDLELMVQSPQVAPARTLLSVFPSARVTIIGDGLMTYSPMRVKLPHIVSARIRRVVYADVVPGVQPLVGGTAALAVPVAPETFKEALLETAASALRDDAAISTLDDGTPTVLVLGQYLSALGLVKPEEEIALQADMIDRAVQWSPERVVFKPHPSAPPLLADAVRERAIALGLEFVEYRGSIAAEVLADRLDVRGVVAGFSTALPTVRELFGREIGSAGTETVMKRLTPFENSNRIPATIVDALTRADSPYQDPLRLQLLIDAVGFVMQPVIAGHLRSRAEQLLTELDPAERERYFSAKRLSVLGLPGSAGETLLGRVIRAADGSSADGVGRIEEWRLTVSGARRRAGRAWRAIRGR
ncbi:polysialyltransferase family glycosyltransferase [Microbacterium sp.]|uniref:polysialyltransferase family glycosyltransferase n=1 Tax=Microbacterium sp. TaxID=51671 RepID=UPI00281133B2|nr:polysialyltransferase family glycosyltransferase [Microbacterium sp.]